MTIPVVPFADLDRTLLPHESDSNCEVAFVSMFSITEDKRSNIIDSALAQLPKRRTNENPCAYCVSCQEYWTSFHELLSTVCYSWTYQISYTSLTRISGFCSDALAVGGHGLSRYVNKVMSVTLAKNHAHPAFQFRSRKANRLRMNITPPTSPAMVEPNELMICCPG